MVSFRTACMWSCWLIFLGNICNVNKHARLPSYHTANAGDNPLPSHPLSPLFPSLSPLPYIRRGCGGDVSRQTFSWTLYRLTQTLAILDEFPECFSDSPGFCNLVEHEIHVTKDFKPKRLRAYRVPESIKPEVERQINDMLKLVIYISNINRQQTETSIHHSRRPRGQLLRHVLRFPFIRCGGTGTRDSRPLQDDIKDLSSLHPVTVPNCMTCLALVMTLFMLRRVRNCQRYYYYYNL